MIGIRQKLMLGFGGLFTVVVVIGVLTMAQINDGWRNYAKYSFRMAG